MMDTGQYPAPADRELARQRRARREADPVIMRLRREISRLRSIPNVEYAEYHRLPIRKLKRELLRKIAEYS